MKRWLQICVPLLLLASTAAVSLPRLQAYYKNKFGPQYRREKVTRGEITQVVNSTGTIQPVLKVSVGTFVSGPIDEIYADFNSEVREGEILATIDKRIYDAAYKREDAALATAQAEVKRVQALLQQAKNDENRSKLLRAENRDYISDAEMDQFRFARSSLEAQLLVAEAAVKQAEANRENARFNLEYTEIKSPVNGIVIDKKIDRGQTLAAQFQTPEMFIVAPDMREKMLVTASVDEADIGLIKKAQADKQPVRFTVDAYPDDLFDGRIADVRMNATTTQMVVTYPVIVEVANPELKLMPFMTATISFQVERRDKAVRIPNAALRFYPRPEQVREQDRKLLEGSGAQAESSTEQDNDPGKSQRSAAERVEATRGRTKRHVWIVEGEWLRAVEVTTGVSDSKHTELLAGELKPDQELVTGLQARTP